MKLTEIDSASATSKKKPFMHSQIQSTHKNLPCECRSLPLTASVYKYVCLYKVNKTTTMSATP